MAKANQLIALLKSHAKGDDTRFYSVAMQLAAHEARMGHGRVAEEMKSIIDAAKETKSVIKDVPGLSPTPIVKPKGDLANLVEVNYSNVLLRDMILPDGLSNKLERVITEQRQQQRLREFGLAPRKKLALVGPPGSGKTMTASALAGELHLPLFTVLLDGLITKFMGETASKLRQVFEAMRTTRGVYFFDEFDALGSRRDQTNDVGEVRRILNSFLQFLEKDDSDSIVVAATNHPELLDPALFRRFDDVIQYDFPDETLVQRIIESRLKLFDCQDLDWHKLSECSVGLSQAEISKATDEAAKNAILDNRKSIENDDLLGAFSERKQANTHKK
jgi:SpoVK/Ycf46/Vps4 family AAA+-type ATPase